MILDLQSAPTTPRPHKHDHKPKTGSLKLVNYNVLLLLFMFFLFFYCTSCELHSLKHKKSKKYLLSKSSLKLPKGGEVKLKLFVLNR